MFHPLDRLELQLRRAPAGTHGIQPPPDLFDQDLATAAEFVGLRWLWLRDQHEDLFEIVPDLEGWAALAYLRSLPLNRSLMGPSTTTVVADRRPRGVGVFELAPNGGGWNPEGPFVSFQQGFCSDLQESGMERKFALALAGALDEMASNAVEHAVSPVSSIACFEVKDRVWSFGVTDVGRGACFSLRENPTYALIEGDTEALKLVLQDGVTRTGDSSRGHGFSYVFKALVDRQASLRFRSGGAAARWEGESPTAQRIDIQSLPLSRTGFHIRVSGAVRRS